MKKANLSWVIDQSGVGIKATAEGKEIFLTAIFDNMDEFEKEVNLLCEEIRFVYAKARDEWLASRTKVEAKEPQDPREFWKVLSKEPRERMIELFNSQSESMRKLVAQYVFENVNVFSGAGAVFAELYDQETCRLEA